ncbi:MAG TPA: TetR/AcrR family transcriptional regulator [Gemmatimonadaceae bacterium]|nr:TetR/AcrR family transcriptional regulator [Gemmatimonadaceae bacterium]
MNTRQRIVEAALEAYGQKGFRGATTRRIAALAGVNEVTIFRHFGSKHALLTEALSHQAPVPVTALPSVPASPLAELSQWTEAHLRSLATRGQVLRASLGDLEERPELVNGAIAFQREALTELSEYLERLRARGLVRSNTDLRTVAAMLTATIFVDATGTDVARGGPSVADRARSYADVALTALGAAGERRSIVQASAPPSMPDATGA